jgi:peptide/nickel transport system substrate-binding protein
MKRLLLAFISVILLLVLAFIGCSSNKTTTQATQQTTKSTTAAVITTTTAATTTTKSTTATTPTATTATITPKSSGTLKYADSMSPSTSIGWIADNGAFTSTLWAPLFMDPLFKTDSNGVVQACLATKYDISSDGKTITITLRQGVKFHDGSDWNATVAKWNIDQLINAKLGDFQKVSSVDIVDTYTIRLNVSTYANTLLSTLGTISIVSQQAYIDHGANQAAIDWMKFNPVGTGPFKFVSYTPNVSIKGIKYNSYWQPGKPYLDAIEIDFIPDALTKSQVLQAGEVNMIGGDLSNIEYGLMQNGSYNLVKAYAVAMCLIPDSKNISSPLSNPQVRMAVDYAIDRTSICNSLGYGFWTPTFQFTPPGSNCQVSGLDRSFNQDKAKQLLTAAGFPNGIKIQLFGSTSTTNKDFATALQGQLSKVGITLDLNIMAHASYSNLRMTGWQNGFVVGGMAFDSNMNYALNANFTQNTVANPSMFKSDDFQNIFNTAVSAKEFTPALTQKAIQYIFDNAMFLPVYCQARGQVMQKYIQDTGFYTGHNFAPWEPANIWFNK